MKSIKISRLALCASALVALIFSPATSHARKPSPTPPPPTISASGNWSDCNVVTDTHPVGPNSFLTVSITETLTGTLSGSFIGTEYDFVHPDGSAVFYGSGVFTGSVAGKTGTFRMNYVGTTSANDTFTAHWVIHDGTGDLSNLFGDGTFEGAASSPTTVCAIPFAGTYKGQLWFAGRR
ncbi:MAG: hypothetical protein QOI34_347 [Verrucomicrobiota bacterium]|jgi:hypothetical protein